MSAEQALGGDGVDVAFAGTMRFHHDVLAHFDAGMALAPRHGLRWSARTASCFSTDPWHCRTPVIELRADGAIERIEIEPADSYRLEAEDFSRAIRGGSPPLLGSGDAVAQAVAIEALYAAAGRGQTVTLG